MTLKSSNDVKKCVMTSKIRYDVKMYVLTSKSEKGTL